ncbi:hypothetical protein [Corynebacterium marquesiae]|uniref:hypothetical protein n=1 Tax=Corynebacterium marquesiae TaxID=2913503 RepID=UPI0038D0BF3C
MTNPFERIANNTARYFTHRGINCMTQLEPFTINGYIELPENHPWLDFPDMVEVHPDIEVHGGITYQMPATICDEGLHTWTWEEVEAETRKLADQAKDANHA